MSFMSEAFTYWQQFGWATADTLHDSRWGSGGWKWANPAKTQPRMNTAMLYVKVNNN